MNIKRTIKDVFQVTASNGVRFAASILTGLLIPIILSVENFGYYRLFVLYATYFGLFHFGFIDGIYLRYGGKNYEDLDKNEFRSFTRFLFYLELIIGVLIILFSVLFLSDERKIVFILLGANVIALNLTTYYQFISQITCRFKEFSSRNFIYAICIAIAVGIIFFFKIDNFKFLLISIIIINYVLLFWYTYTYRDITWGSINRNKHDGNALIGLFKLGIPLLLANLMTVLVLNFGKQLVDWKFDIESFAIFSFSYSLMAFANVFITALSTIVYPNMKRVDPRKLARYYSNAVSLIMIIVFLALIFYFPLVIFVNHYLPDYSNSLIILKYIFPGLVVSSTIQIVKLNYFKTLQKVKSYLITGMITLVFTIFINFAAYYVFRSLEAIAISSVISFLFWYLITEAFFVRDYKISPYKNICYLVLIIMLFYVCASIENIFVGVGIYIFLLMLITVVFFRKMLIGLVKKTIF